MKKTLLSSLVLFVILLSFTPQKAKAAWAAGGEMYYSWLSDSTYRVYVRYYRSCTGIPATGSISGCLSGSCSTTTYTFTLNPVGILGEVPTSCPSYVSKCVNPSSSIPGYQVLLYQADVTLPYRCSSWKFSVSISASESAQNVGGGNMYLEAMINNTGTYQGNSSPYVPANGIYFVCNSYPASYNSNATDPNNDSLDTEVSAPLDGGLCGPPAAISFQSATPALRLPDNPFQANNTFSCNANTGAMSFTPGTQGNQYIGVKIKEYRAGVLIGYITRSVRFITFNCSAKPPAVGNIVAYTGTYSTSGGVSGCPGLPIGFSVDLKSTVGSVLYATDNKTQLPGTSTITYSNQNTDSIRAVFNWTPPASLAAKTTTYYLSFNVKDSTCNSSMPMIVNSAIVVPITIWGKPVADKDTTICQGKTATLTGKGGGNYTWSQITGTPGSLGCTTCSTTTATPNITSTYLLTSALSAFCGNNLDTVTVTVKSPVAPSVSIVANPGTTITAGTKVTFTCYATNCATPSFTWKLNGTVITTGPTYISSTLNSGDVVSVQLSCGDECTTQSTATSSITMNVTPASIGNVENTGKIAVVPNPNNGKFTLVISDKLVAGKIEITNTLGQVIYTGETSQPDIDLHNAAKGVYMLRLLQGDQIHTLRFAIDK